MPPFPGYPRLPVAPLQGDGSLLGLAGRLGVNNKQVHRWINEGGIPLYSADKAAITLGMHPADVWGQEWWDACAAMSEHEAAAAGQRAFSQWVSDWLRSPFARARRELVIEADRCARWLERHAA